MNKRKFRPYKKKKWNDRVVQVRRVTKVCKGGKKLSFRAVVVIGNYGGKVGVGIGKAEEVMQAINKGKVQAKNNLIDVKLTKSGTLSHVIKGKFGACEVLIKPASSGTGVIAGGATRIVLELAGVKNILAKQLGSDSLLNNAYSTIEALKSLKDPVQVASERNIKFEKIYS